MEENKKESTGNNVAAKNESDTTAAAGSVVSASDSSSTKITDAEIVNEESTLEEKKETATTEAVTKEVTTEEKKAEKTDAAATTVSSETVSSETKQGSMKTVVAFIAGVAVAFFVNMLFSAEHFGMAQDGFKETRVVAKVNGEKIFGKELNQQVEQFAVVRGYPAVEDLDEEVKNELASQALDALINTELIAQAAKREGIEVSEEEIATQYDRLIESIGGQEAADERFAELGTNAEEFRAGLEDEILVGKYMEVAVSAAAVEVSDSEVEAYYNEVAAATPEGVPALEEVKPVIVEQVQLQKQQAALMNILQGLREGALIEEMI